MIHSIKILQFDKNRDEYRRRKITVAVDDIIYTGHFTLCQKNGTEKNISYSVHLWTINHTVKLSSYTDYRNIRKEILKLADICTQGLHLDETLIK